MRKRGYSKKLLAALLAASMITSNLPVTAMAEDTEVTSDGSESVNSGGGSESSEQGGGSSDSSYESDSSDQDSSDSQGSEDYDEDAGADDDADASDQADEKDNSNADAEKDSDANEDADADDAKADSDADGSTSSTEEADQTLATEAEDDSLGYGPTQPDNSQSRTLDLVTKSSGDSSYTNVDTTITTEHTNESLRLIMTALTENNKDLFVKAIQEYYKEPIEDGSDYYYSYLKLVNSEFLDAEKWSVHVEEVDGKLVTTNYDSNLCWAAAASNMLWESGWMDGVTNPLTGKAFSSSDEILTYFATYFTDAGSQPVFAVEWIMDAIYQMQGRNAANSELTTNQNKYDQSASAEKASSDSTAADASATTGTDSNVSSTENTDEVTDASSSKSPYGYGIDQGGLLSDICASTIYEFITLSDDDMDKITKLIGIGTDIVAGLGVYFLNPATGEAKHPITGQDLGGHALTVIGSLVDTAKSGFESIVALLIADSDNDASQTEANAPKSADEATATKLLCPNSYTLYYMGQYLNPKTGEKNLTLENYASGLVTIIGNMQTLQIKKKESVEAATETEGTGNVMTTPDLTIVSTDTMSKEKSKSKTQYKSCTQYKEGQDIYFTSTINNDSHVILNSSTAKANKINCLIKVYRNGKYYGQLSTDVILGTNGSIAAMSDYTSTIKLNQNMKFIPGKYRLEYYINLPDSNGNKALEAYFKNNSVVVNEFTVVANNNNGSSDNGSDKSSVDYSRFIIRTLFITDDDSITDNVNVYYKDIDGKFYVYVNRDAVDYDYVTCDGEKIDSKYCQLEDNEDGSFQVLISKDYMDSLSDGNHYFGVKLTTNPDIHTVQVTVK